MESGDLGQPLFKLAEDLGIPLRLIQRNKRVKTTYVFPSDGQHLRRGIQLHRAGTERDHRGGQRQILGLQPAQVAQHLGLGMITVEDRMGEIGRGTSQMIGRLPGNRITAISTGPFSEKLDQLIR